MADRKLVRTAEVGDDQLFHCHILPMERRQENTERGDMRPETNRDFYRFGHD